MKKTKKISLRKIIRNIHVCFLIATICILLPCSHVYADPEDNPESETTDDRSGSENMDRYTVLLLDISGPQTFHEDPSYMNLWGTDYTSDSSIESVKKAAK